MKTLNCSLLIGLITASLMSLTPSLKANVYASNIKINGTTNSASLSPGGGVNIDYVLNEPASAGVTVDILAGATVVRSLVITSGSPGTLRGTNEVIWDGKNDSAAYVAPGSYSFRITAKSTGYAGWTQISNDSDPGMYSYEPTGIAVNKNTNSPYYGRVFLANSEDDTPGFVGDQNGIILLNADGSFATASGFSTGGWTWASDDFSPWKMQVSADDKLYVNDWTGNGNILAFDQDVTTNNYLAVLRDDNNPTGPGGYANMSGPAITGTGTNTQIWMADINTSASGGTGITRWNVTTNGTCAQDDSGTSIIPLGGDLDTYPYYVDVDKSSNIFVIQFPSALAPNPSPRVLRYAPYAGTSETTAVWKVGMDDDSLRGAIGLGVDSTGTYLAVSFSVRFPNAGGVGRPRSGGVAILRASDGSTVTHFLAGVDMPAVTWDNVGNVYGCDNDASLLRIYSPPGTNQATTYGLAAITVGAGLKLQAQSWSTNQFHFTLAGTAGQSYIIQSSTNFSAWTPVLTNNDATAIRNLTLPTTDSKTFYRALQGQ